MSFKAELESLIANANSSLEDLEAILRRAQSRSGQGNSHEVSDGDVDVREIKAKLDTVRQRILASLLEIRESYNHDQERLSDLKGELKLDLENVRQCAIDYFIKGEYRECERLLSFLAKVQPSDENLENFLDLSRRKQLEHETGRSSAAPDRQSHSKDSNNEQQLPHEQPVAVAPQGEASGDDLEPPLRKTETPLPPGSAGELESPPSAFQLGQAPLAQSETVEPQILAEIELRTAAHINETYRTSSNPTKGGFLVWVAAAGLLLASTLYWVSRPRPESSVPESLLPPPPKAEGLVSPEDPLESLRQEAQALFDAGKVQEAGRVSDAILAKKPEDIFAGALKDSIRATLAELKTQADEAAPSELTAQLHQTPTGQSPGGPSAGLQVRNQPLPSEASLQPALSTDHATRNLKRIDATVQKPSEQRPTGEQLTPAKPAAPAPASVVPTIPATSQIATVPQIGPDQLQELNSRIQAKDFDQARLLLERLESGFPGNPDLRTLGERLRVEAGKQQSQALSWIEKADVAWIAGRYVTPPDDNVLVYCNLALKADPKNQRAASLKREIVQRAVSQAKDWIQRGKFDAARLSYASMDYLAVGDDTFPYPKSDLKRELEKLGFRTYPMVHDHKLGSCSGMLKFNSYAVSYVPSGGSDDGFTESLNSIVINEEGERLKISYRDRSFRFRSENGNAVQAIYQQLLTRMSDEKSILATRNKDTR